MSGPYVFEADFFLGQTVAFVLDSSVVGLVTGISIYDGGKTYRVIWSDNRQETSHYAFELRASEGAIAR